MKAKTQQTLEKIQELLKQKTAIEAQLEKLVNPTASASENKPDKTDSLPAGFTITGEVVRIVDESPQKISTDKIMNELVRKFPTYNFTKSRVNSAIVYAASIGKIERVGRGKFRTKQPAHTLAEIYHRQN